MINEKDADKAANFIRDHAEKLALAKSQRVYCEEYRKSLKAILFSQMEGNVSEREHKAYGHERYLKHLDELKQAVFEEEKLRGLIKAAEIKCDLYRSFNANLRGLK